MAPLEHTPGDPTGTWNRTRGTPMSYWVIEDLQHISMDQMYEMNSQELSTYFDKNINYQWK